MSAGFSPVLSLDYERVISQWGQGSVFSSSDFSLDEYTAGDVFLDLDGADEFAAFGLFEFDDVAVPPTTCVPNQPLPNQFPKAPPCCPSSAYEQPKPSNHYIDNWQCFPEMHVNKEQGCTAFFSTPSVCFSCSSEPCTVPDNMHSSATSECPAGPGTLNGLVPQPSQFMCMSLSPVAAPPQIQLETISDAMLQRRECLRRYRDKKARRMYTKMIRYRLRKINADKRPRIKGRFVKKEFQQDVAAGMDIEDHNVSGSQPGPADAYMSDDSL